MNTQYKTRTLAFAAFLVAGKHLRLDHVEVTDSLGVFVFEDNGRARQLEAAFHTQDAVVPAQQFYRTVRTLRRMVESGKQRNANQFTTEDSHANQEVTRH